ncbi:MAG: ATP-binding protein [Spirochaetales bacterium]
MSVVRFLLIQDLAEDENLVLSCLRGAGYVAEHQRIASLEAVRLHASDGWDFLLCEHTLPGFSALEVLKVVQALAVPPPLIVLAGPDASPAVDLIRAGASDCVFKDSLERLPLAIERGIREGSLRLARLRAEIQLARLGRVHQIHSSFNKAIFRSLGSPLLLQEVCGIATRFGQYSLVRVLQRWEDRLVTVATSRSALLEHGLEPRLTQEKRALESGQEVIENLLTDRGGFRSSGVFPLTVDGKLWGCLSFYSQEEGVFTPEEVGLLGEMAHDLAWALDTRLAEERRHEADQFLQDMTNLLPGLFYKLVRRAGKWSFQYLSPGIDLFVPFTPEQVMANFHLVQGAVHPQDLGRFRAALDESARNLTVFSLEFRLIRPNGSTVWTLATSFPQEQSDGAVVWTGLAIDVTPQHKLQETLQREQELLAVTLENIGDGVIAIGEEGQVILINRTTQTLLDWSDSQTVGRHWSELDLRLPWEARDTLTPWTLDLPDGRSLHLETHVSDLLDAGGEIRGRVMLLRDVSQRERIEERLRQSEKLESIGLLAGGIAHDFNNLLTGMFGFLQLARMNTESAELVGQYLDNALGPFERARALTQQLLTFAKGGQPTKHNFRLLENLNQTLEFVLGSSGITWKVESPKDLWPVFGNEGQIGQVFENLVLNAKQVLEPGKGLVTVHLENRPAFEHPDSDLPVGDYVVIEVRDTGPGIPSSVLPRIFDPFFTTKPSGTGLGLSICFSVVKKHGGVVEVESEPGKGTLFRVYLPAGSA